MNLNGGILGKVSVVDRGKALVYRGQSQKLSLACSVGKKKKMGARVSVSGNLPLPGGYRQEGLDTAPRLKVYGPCIIFLGTLVLTLEGVGKG